MGFLDRLRSQPDWKHEDAAVRLAAVTGLDGAEQEILALVARDDSDPRVRRAAVRRLADIDQLALASRNDPDETVRLEASRGLLAFSLDAQDEALALKALGAISSAKDLMQVAKSATLESVSLAALARSPDLKARASIARRSVHAATRLGALAAIDDALELAAIASRTEHRDVGVAALERIDDASLLARVADRARDKHVARRAGQLRQPPKGGSAPPPDVSRTDRRLQTELCDAVTALATHEDLEQLEARLSSALESWNDLIPDVDDDLADRFQAACEAGRRQAGTLLATRREAERVSQNRIEILTARTAVCAALDSARGDEPAEFLDALQQSWFGQGPLSEPDAARMERRFQEAVAVYQRRRESWGAGMESLARIAEEIEQLAREGAVFRGDRAAVERWGALAREWRALPAAVVEAHSAQAEAVRLLESRLAEREAEARAERERRQRNNLSRLEQFCSETETMLSASPALKDVSRRQRQIQSLLENPPTLPSKLDQDAIIERLKGLQTRLGPQLQELREIDDWERWANVGVQEELCARVEALGPVTDPAVIARELRDIEQRWRQASAVPREKAQALWRRYRTGHDAVRGRLNEHFARLAVERTDNLRRKEALVAQAESLSGSSDWIRTAEAIQRLQAEWKTLGTAAPADERAVWQRFRTACNLFFTRRREDLVDRKRAWTENYSRKEALAVRAETLAESSDWDAAAAEIRGLQADWKTIGPVRRNRSEAIWQRFRAACDRFFERYQQRGQADLQQRLVDRDALCRELEGLATLELPTDHIADLAPRLDNLHVRWQSSPPVPRAPLADLEARFKAALERVVVVHAEALRGSDYDADRNRQRMEELCARVEALAGAAVPEQSSPAAVLAARWREALASTTIGGRVDDDARVRAAIREVREARGAWERIGYVPDAARRTLAERFDRACRRFFDQRQRSGSTPPVGAPR